MSTVKTITAKMIQTILADDFDVGLLVSNQDRRRELANIAPDEVDELINRLTQVKDYVSTAQEERQKEALEVLKGIIGEQSMFETVEELIEAATGVIGSSKRIRTVPRTTSTTANNNKTFTVVIDRKEFSVINKKIPAALRDNEAYKKLIKARPEMENVDNLLREYSTDYQKAYPFNAKYDGKLFHMNERGKLNEVSTEYFTDYQKKYTNGDIKDFKEHVKAEFASHK